MKIYKSCETLPVRRFFKVFETDDLRYLIVDFDNENDDKALTEKQLVEFSRVFEDIYFEYSEITHNHKLRSTLKKQFLIEEWSLLYTMISSFLNLYIEHGNVEVLVLINNFNEKSYRIDLEKPIKPQIPRLIQRLKGLKNKIKIFKIKLSKSMETNKEDVKMDLDRDALYLERNLELKREIDPDTTTVSKWVKLIQMSKEKHKSHAANSNRK